MLIANGQMAKLKEGENIFSKKKIKPINIPTWRKHELEVRDPHRMFGHTGDSKHSVWTVTPVTPVGQWYFQFTHYSKDCTWKG